MNPTTLYENPCAPRYSVRLRAPGRPLSPSRRRRILERARRGLNRELTRWGLAPLSACAADEGDLLRLAGPGLGLSDLCRVQEGLIKGAAGALHADLLGGANVTRLDRMITTDLPRLDYPAALEILAARGHDLAFGEDLDPAAAASLIRYCGNLPVQVLGLPRVGRFGVARPRNDTAAGDCACCLLPLAGEAGRVLVDGGGLALLQLGLGSLMQYFMGLEDQDQAVV